MSDEELSRLDREYDVHPLSANQAGAIRLFQMQCKILARYIAEHLPQTREQRLALTKLEEAMFWGREAIARS